MIDRYECNCTDTGYFGTHCEQNINDCEPNPCVHGEECTDGVKVRRTSHYSGLRPGAAGR